MGFLVEGEKSLDAKVVGEKELSLLSEDRLKILRCLGGEAKYPAQVARELGLQVQTVYYHFRLLEGAGLVKFVEAEEHGGATAKKFGAAGDAFAVVVNNSAWRPFASAKHREPPSLLAPFISNGHFDGRLVLGSPDPHGKYRARGSELCSAELSMFLGSFASFSYPLYVLDTELKGNDRRGGLIALGGPKVNTFVAELNTHLPVFFDESTFGIRSKPSGKTYEEDVGVVELVENPANPSRHVLLLAGTSHNSTRIAVLALIKEREKLEKGNLFDSSINAKVVQGFDEDGDGIVDAVEVLE